MYNLADYKPLVQEQIKQLISVTLSVAVRFGPADGLI